MLKTRVFVDILLETASIKSTLWAQWRVIFELHLMFYRTISDKKIGNLKKKNALFKLVCILVNFLRSVKMSIKVSSAFKKSSYRISPNLSMFSNFRALMRFPVDSTKSIKIFRFTLSPYFTRIYPKITRKSILFHPSIMTHHMIS